MFAFKKKYFLLINNIKDINLNKINRNHKLIIIFRNLNNFKDKDKLLNFRRKCKLLRIKFFVANDLNLATFLKSDGLYISASNKSYRPLQLKKINKEIIGSAHDVKQIYEKINQGCSNILVSKLFQVEYDQQSKVMGLVKFNNLVHHFKNIVPLGGIKMSNLNKMLSIRCNGFAIMTEIKKKPAISNRLF